MASEDSVQLVPGLLPVHRLSDASDFDQTVHRKTTAGLDHRGGCHTAYCREPDPHRRTHGARAGRTRSARPASPRTREQPGNRSCSRFGPGGLAAARIRLRSILLRLRNRSPSHRTRSAFPAGFPHSSRCHCRHHVGCIRVVRDTRVFQHIARCAPRHYWCGGQRIASGDYCPFWPRYLRTVIVTAAVYRGLDSRLRPKANLSS